jgi:hypothetical protein
VSPKPSFAAGGVSAPLFVSAAVVSVDAVVSVVVVALVVAVAAGGVVDAPSSSFELDPQAAMPNASAPAATSAAIRPTVMCAPPER